MNKTASTVTWLHGSSFTVFFIVNTVLEYFAYPAIKAALESDFWLIITSTLVSAFLYFIIYTVISKIYDIIVFKKTIKKIKHDKLWIKGTWYHVHVPYNNEGEMIIDSLRAGETIFHQSLYDVKATVAENDSYALDDQGNILKVGDRHTQWTHPYVFILEGEKLNIIYNAGATHDTRILQHKCSLCGAEYPEGKEIFLAGQERLGIHTLTIKSATMIEGTYRDAAPSVNRGTIKFFRNKEDRDNEIKEYFRRVEYKKKKQQEKV